MYWSSSFALFVLVISANSAHGVDSSVYDCTSKNIWSIEQTLWCCENERIGCFGHVTAEQDVAPTVMEAPPMVMPLHTSNPLPTVATSSSPIIAASPKVAAITGDEVEGLSRTTKTMYTQVACMTKELWSAEKQLFCCSTYNMGCLKQQKANDLEERSAVVAETTEECDRNCPRDSSPVCGNDDETYRNACLLRLKACLDTPSLVLKHEGPCHIDIIAVSSSTPKGSQAKGCCLSATAACMACQKKMSLYDYCNWSHESFPEDVYTGCAVEYNCNSREIFHPAKQAHCNAANKRAEKPIEVASRMAPASQSLTAPSALASPPASGALTLPKEWGPDTQPHDPVAAIAAGVQEVVVHTDHIQGGIQTYRPGKDLNVSPAPFPPRYLALHESASDSLSIVWAEPVLMVEHKEANSCPQMLYDVMYAPVKKGEPEDIEQTVTTPETFLHLPQLGAGKKYRVRVSARWMNPEHSQLRSTFVEETFRTKRAEGDTSGGDDDDEEEGSDVDGN